MVANRAIALPRTDANSATLTTLRAPSRSISVPPNTMAMTSADAEKAVMSKPCIVYEIPRASIIDGWEGGTFPYCVEMRMLATMMAQTGIQAATFLAMATTPPPG